MTLAEAGEALEEQRRTLARMPILRELLSHLQRDGFSFGPNVFLFGTQHLMAQSLGLCGVLNSLGLSYDRMYLAGKVYSSHLESIRHLRALGVHVPEPRPYRLGLSQTAEQVFDLRELSRLLRAHKATSPNPLILVLDDGGHALTGVTSWLDPPFMLGGVEQTASGSRQPGVRALHFPTVDVGASAVKRRCEPRMIVEAALSRAEAVHTRCASSSVGIVGLGYIGLALHEVLSERGHLPCIFDLRGDAYPRVQSGQRARRVHEVFNSCELIFGCTGVDITRDLIEDVRQRGLERRTRRLVSLSSGDDEFFTLKSRFRSVTHGPAYAIGDIPDVQGNFAGSRFIVMRNGFPINFDNSGESAPLERIQGTMAALVAALCQVQALALGISRPGRVTLDVAFQEWLYSRWLHYLPNLSRAIKPFSRTRAEKLSEPRFDRTSTVFETPFGGWTADRSPIP